MKPGATGLTRLAKAFGYSMQGFAAAWRNEAAIRQEIAATLVLVPLALWLGGSGVERALLIGSWLLVPLTELLNRRSIDETFRLEIQRARRYGGLLSVLLIDLDQFKKINDGEGHVAGDEALVEISRRLQAACREIDTLGRWGGV